jgi:YVTN family beta-propeller protein
MGKKAYWVAVSVILSLLLSFHMAMGQSAGGFAYVGNIGSGTISVIDVATHTVVETIPNVNPTKFFVAPDALRVYSQRGGAFGYRLDVINTVSHSLELTGFGGRVTNMGISPDSSNLYIGTHNPYQAYTGGQCRFGGGLNFYDAISYEHLSCIDTGESGPSPFSVRPDGKYVYVGKYGGNPTCSRCSILMLIDEDSNNLIGHIMLPTANLQFNYHFLRRMVQDVSGRYLFLTAITVNENDHRWDAGILYKIDMTTNEIISTVPRVQCGFDEIAVPSNNSSVCVTDFREKRLYIVNQSDNSYCRLEMGEEIKCPIISPDDRYVYVLKPASNRVGVVDLSTNTEITNIPVATKPFDMALTPDGRYIYVTNRNSHSVSVIDISNNTVAATIAVGQYPEPVAMIPRQNRPPEGNAGPDLSIVSQDLTGITIQGVATDPDGDALEYRWLDGEIEVSSWSSVGTNGEAHLILSQIPLLDVGEHILTLEVRDNETTVRDMMTLTVGNSAPCATASGTGTFQINTPIVVGGQISDFDGDLLTYEWLVGEEVVFTGEVQAPLDGSPIALDEYMLPALPLGVHSVTLRVADETNPPVTAQFTVDVIDTVAPTLSPVSNLTMLWPPNHTMRDIEIWANATDNSGMPVTISVIIASSEAQNGLGDGDTTPDWTEPVIDQLSGLITFQLRAERFGGGKGREYTVLVNALDSENNSSQAQLKILVPHDKRAK